MYVCCVIATAINEGLRARLAYGTISQNDMYGILENFNHFQIYQAAKNRNLRGRPLSGCQPQLWYSIQVMRGH